MSFQITALRYGWAYLTALGTLGLVGTIYMLNPTRHQVTYEDMLEINLGIYERCLATQTGTNADGSGIYLVTPADLIQSWAKTNATVLTGAAYRVCYTSYWPSTTGVGVVQSYTSSVQPSVNYAASWTATDGWVWTNVSMWPSITVTDSYETVTNVIGWFPSRDYMITLYGKLKALVPCYVDTNSVYDGTTNIVTLSFTGLLTSLHLGDGTNLTATPCWTNPVSTNWVVNYTSYWPSTDGTPTNIVYTSNYRQVVNYAQSWTATGGHVWVASSNWVSSVVTITNVATYGDVPWQIYVEDLQEWYKVLNALKMTKGGAGTGGFIANTNVIALVQAPAPPEYGGGWTGSYKSGSWADYYPYYSTWEVEMDEAEAAFSADVGAGTVSDPGQLYMLYMMENAYGLWRIVDIVAERTKFTVGPFPTNGQTHSVLVEAQATRGGFEQFSSQGAVGAEDEWVPIISVTDSTSEYEQSGLLGTLDMPQRPDTNSFPDVVGGRGNVHQTRITVSYGPRPYYWTINGVRVDNPTDDPRCTEFSKSVSLESNGVSEAAITVLKSDAETAFASATIIPGEISPYAYASITRSGTEPVNLNWSVSLSRSYGIWETVYISTSIPHGTVEAYLRGKVSDTNSWTYDANEDAGETTDTYRKMPDGTEISPGTSYKFTFGNVDLPVPNWPDSPATNTTTTKGYVTRDRTVYIPWQFNYCTNKYW
jgi:hypothetical protein